MKLVRSVWRDLVSRKKKNRWDDFKDQAKQDFFDLKSGWYITFDRFAFRIDSKVMRTFFNFVSGVELISSISEVGLMHINFGHMRDSREFDVYVLMREVGQLSGGLVAINSKEKVVEKRNRICCFDLEYFRLRRKLGRRLRVAKLISFKSPLSVTEQYLSGSKTQFCGSTIYQRFDVVRELSAAKKFAEANKGHLNISDCCVTDAINFAAYNLGLDQNITCFVEQLIQAPCIISNGDYRSENLGFDETESVVLFDVDACLIGYYQFWFDVVHFVLSERPNVSSVIDTKYDEACSEIGRIYGYSGDFKNLKIAVGVAYSILYSRLFRFKRFKRFEHAASVCQDNLEETLERDILNCLKRIDSFFRTPNLCE